MMTITKLRGAEYLLLSVADGVEDYFMGAGEAPGVWHGRWATELGLTGVVVADDLRALVEGHDPATGINLLAGNKERVVKAIDLTLSAPKSASLLWAFGDPATTSAVSIAMATASDIALDFLEQHAAVARQQIDGVRRQVATGGFIVAEFTHRTSRAGDPQLHVHCLVPNVIQRDDGSRVAIDAGPIHQWLKASGTIFQAELQRQLTNTLDVVWGPERNGCREMLGFDRAQLRAFSKRTVAIETVLEAGPEAVTAKERMKADDRASLATRQRKDDTLTPEVLRDRWENEATRAGIPRHTDLLDTLRHQTARDDLVGRDQLFAALVDPDTGMCANKARFGHAHVVERIAALSAGRWTTSEITTAAEEFLRSSLVVRLTQPATGRRRPTQWSTVEHRQLEDHVLDGLQQLRSSQRPGADLDGITAAIDRSPVQLGDDQAEAVKVLCSEGPALKVVLAAAGYGKTALTTTAPTVARSEGRAVVALAATNKAAAELRIAGLDASTIARWRLDGATLPAGAVVVLDEVSQVSTRDAAAVLDAVTRTSDARLWCLGDEDQGRSVKPGGLASELARLERQDEVVAAELTVNRRQLDPDEQAALARYRAGGVADSQQIRNSRGWEHSAATPAAARDGLADAVVADIARYGVTDVAVLAVSHVDCEDVADRIRHRLRQAGHLTGPEAAGPGWGPDDRYYAAGDRILLHANAYIDGDQVHNGTTGQVTAVDPTGALDVALDDGRQLTLAPGFVTGTRPDGTPNLSHAWARTIDGAQGGTWDHVHVLAGPSVDRHTLYVGQSRGRHPTHTWNIAPDPNDEAHGNVVTGDRDPDQLVLAAAARRPDTHFAAWDDPYVLDRQLRDERTEHREALAAGPPDRRAEVASLGRQLDQLTRDARHHYDALRRAESLARQTARPHLRRNKRDRHRHAADAVQAATDALEATQEQVRVVRAELLAAQSAQTARERWELSQRWRHDEIARIDHDLAQRWATAVLDATHDGAPLAYGLEHLRDAARTIAADTGRKQDHAVLEDALRSCRVHRVIAIYRGDELPPAHLTEELGEIPGPGPARAVWAALATRVEHRLDTIGPEPEHERSPVHRQLRRLVQRYEVEPAELIEAAHRLPAVDLDDAGVATWTHALEQATQLHHEQPARVVERGFGLSL